ncbi:hypothetical protein ATE84_2030 [Aquimarina sp. MAR_2010_214]|uniref:hypothetical protein n=1 Tax=Aquimarina sp. MAR_2010_214 TaxID=1250026 RepID=UPI000CAA2A25|nr:hypothetical protein [Aquimarina sp. MAR_2010_214]PKV49984.1 hypothetical protein ATE84_2030 [Aquimarina sp. MAR_2010_214]
MLKNILKLDNVKKLDSEQQQTINGGWGLASCYDAQICFTQCPETGGCLNPGSPICNCY